MQDEPLGPARRWHVALWHELARVHLDSASVLVVGAGPSGSGLAPWWPGARVQIQFKLRHRLLVLIGARARPARSWRRARGPRHSDSNSN